MLYISQLINGLQLGSIYALVALGYSMVYGIIMLLNFAHGDIIMVGGYLVMTVLLAGFGPVAAVGVSIAGCTLLAVLIERVAYRPLRGAPRISLLITAIGVSMLLQNVAQLIFGADSKPVAASQIIPPVRFGTQQLSVSLTAIVTVAVTVLSMLALTFLVKKTRMGKAMRAVSEDMGAAQLMGIPVDRVISFTFAVGSALAGIGAVLYCCRYPQVKPALGALLGLKAFVAAVLGGIGSIPGAMLGGLAIGLCEVFVTAIGLSQWTEAVVFGILIAVLLVRPTGFLGRTMQEKV